MWSVRVRPIVGESLDSFIARQAAAMECSPTHLIRQVSQNPTASYLKPNLKLLAAAAGLECRSIEAMSNRHRPYQYHLTSVQVPSSCRWYCPDCADEGIVARNESLLLHFACLEHDRLKINLSQPSGATDLDDELRDLQQRIHGFLSWAGSGPSVNNLIRAIRPLAQRLSYIAKMTEHGSEQDEDPASAELREVVIEHAEHSPRRAAELLRYVWPIVESPVLRQLVLVYLDRFENWRRSHPDPRHRNVVYGTQETVPLWTLVSVPRQITRFGRLAESTHVPQMFGFHEEDCVFDCSSPETDRMWRNRGIAGQLARDLLEIQNQLRAGQSIQLSPEMQRWDRCE